MSGIVLYDDAVARAFAPFARTRPAGELVAGALLTRRRWESVLGRSAVGFVSAPHLASFEEFDAPPAVSDTIPAGTWLVNSRCCPTLEASAAGTATVLVVDGMIGAVRLAEPLPLAALVDGVASLDALAPRTGIRTTLAGWWLSAVWDLVGHLPAMLAADAGALATRTGTTPALPSGVQVIGTHPVVIAADARIEPQVVIDATTGAVVIGAGATVQAFTRLQGPVVIAPGAAVLGGRLACVSIGEGAKVHGELSVSIVIGHANKGHDGFVGHSIIGRWANLGAGTITSNLKNSYGPVSCWTPTGLRETGLQFLGALIGDHAKTGIGTRLTTGCVVGAGANVVDDGVTPKAVPPFAWGAPPAWGTYDVERFLSVAERVMARRGVRLTDGGRAQLRTAHATRDAG
ncbi:MAG: putative sugar nucleotidyl transferase [Gemmatimonadota bacterium]|nr:putative sugar nucleotidyl transferase [Gemmatimonadota bacterium]MDQ8147109.1 putative sugar nucleotidyl transferase [Gemmatimonadota bacterium]MDQ8148988.1 putative sugar nucleotidyl transferase [Gemmatimonadota bacterium]MDQ8156670.1 putative sugar nucleotidyl transferase [Gemmatimonadota bacterium]MDQ8176438.1 putative sugar nucleotidyl transferase [Gemmatimonadota bacterium]